jgi:cytochrome c556
MQITKAESKLISAALAFCCCRDVVLDLDEKQEAKVRSLLFKILKEEDLGKIEGVELPFENIKYLKAYAQDPKVAVKLTNHIKMGRFNSEE